MPRARSGVTGCLILPRAAADVNAASIGVNVGVHGPSSDFPSRIARVGRPESVVPVQILRVTVSVVQIRKVPDRFACIVLDFFRAGIVSHNEAAAHVANGIHEKSRDRLARAGWHVNLVSLVPNARDFGGGSARGGCRENFSIVQQEHCVVVATRHRDGVAGGVARTAADNSERYNVVKGGGADSHNINYESVTSPGSRRRSHANRVPASCGIDGCAARGRTSRNRLQRSPVAY